MSEQWKTDGKCLECRRHGYCKTQCSKNRDLMYAEMRRILMEKMPVYKEVKEMSQASGNSPETDE